MISRAVATLAKYWRGVIGEGGAVGRWGRAQNSCCCGSSCSGGGACVKSDGVSPGYCSPSGGGAAKPRGAGATRCGDPDAPPSVKVSPHLKFMVEVAPELLGWAGGNLHV